MEDEQRVVKVDVGARRILRSFRVDGHPHNIYAGGTVATALQAAGRIALIHGRSVKHVELGGSPHDVKGWGELFVVANEGAARLDVVTIDGDFLGSIPLKANPHDLAIALDYSATWVSLDGSDNLAVVDIGERKVLRYISTGKRPHDLLFTPDGRLWVTDWNGELHVFSKAGKLITTVQLGMEAHHLAFTPRLRAGRTQRLEVWITDHEARRVFVVDGQTFEVLASLRMEGSPHHVAVTPDGRWAVVADHDRGSLIVFSVARHEKVAEIPVGAGPHGVWAP